MADKALIEQLKAQVAAAEANGDPAAATAPTRRKSRGLPHEAGSLKARNAEIDLASADDALSKIVALVNVSDRSEHVIRERLERCDFTLTAIEEAVDRARSYGFIDDDRFAATLIRSRLSQGKGIPGIGRELRTHGIDIDSVPGWPEEFDAAEDSELDRALAFLDKRPPRSKNLRDGAYRKLIGRGFSSGTASSAARIWSQRCDACSRSFYVDEDIKS